MIVNRSAPPGPVVPVLVYDDVEKAIAWLCGAFAFTERLRTPPEPDGTIHHVQLAIGEGAVILTAQGAVRTQNVYVQVDEIDKHYLRAKEFGARILSPPKTCAFGERQYSAEDLGGNRWTFSQSVADVPPEEWGAKVSEIKSRLSLLPRPRLCYLEIPALDISQSVAFYEKVFGWKIRHRESTRPSFDDATGYVSGAWVTGRPPTSEPGLLPYIWVDDIDGILTRITANGGKVVDGSHFDEPGSTSRIATFLDPAGNRVGLYQEDSG